MAEIKLSFWSFANANPTELALATDSGEELSCAELLSRCNSIANGLQALGLKKGDSVALMLPNCVEFLAIYLATSQIGIYLVPINWHLAGAEVSYIVKDCEAKVFIAHSDTIEAATEALQESSLPGSHAFAVGDVPGFRNLSELMDDNKKAPEKRYAGSVMNYTSGTTGKPKGVRRPLMDLDPDTAAELFTFSLQMFDIRPYDHNVHITGSPLYHTAVLVWASASFHMGHTVVLMKQWEAENMLQMIDRYRVTHSHMVPTQFRRLLLLSKDVRDQYNINSLRYMIHAAAPCPPEIKRRMLAWWGNVIYEYYAATEGGGTLVTPQEWLRYPGTVGKAWPGADIKILDDDGKPVPVGKQGTIYMLTNQAMRFEYKGDRKKTESSFVSDYFTVGDIGYLNKEGFLFLCDRKIDMIISGGANIYPAEIENVLIEHDKVSDVAVFGIPNEDWGEEIKAVVELTPDAIMGDALTKELLAFCTKKLAKMKCPRSIDYTTDMPRDPNGKLYKRRLRDPYWEGKQRQV